jgi:hypothetical protein
MRRSSVLMAFCLALGFAAFAADVTVPQQAVAGSKLSLATSGSGEATVIVVGPSSILKRKVQLGQPITLEGDDIANAGRYQVILESGDGNAARSFLVVAGKPAHLSFIAHPSRAPVAQRDGIRGSVYAFDADNNLVTQPVQVTFKVTGAQIGSVQKQATSKNGVASVALDSPRREGAVQFQASSGDVTATRVVRVVADEPCGLRIHAQRQPNGLEVETDPVKDCSGNLVPDGTVVTFTEYDGQGRSTVDANVKKGIARATLPAQGEVRISAASGVALGNEVVLKGNE